MIIFIYGPDSYRSRAKLIELKEKFIKELDPNAQSLNVIDGSGTTMKEISEKINTGSLFIKKRMVIIENIFENKKEKVFEELENFLKNKKEASKADEDDIIIFKDSDLNNKETKLKKEAKKLFTFLSSQKYVQEFKNLSGSQLNIFAQEEFKKLNRKIETPALKLLLERTGDDLLRLSSEIHKLAMMVKENGVVTTDDVKNEISGSFDENIFQLTDAISARQQKIALRLLEEQYLAGLSEDYILTMLIRQFKIMLQVKSAQLENQSPTQMASNLKLHPFVIKKSLSQVSNFSLEELKRKLNHLISLDFGNKTGQKDLKTELALFVFKI